MFKYAAWLPLAWLGGLAGCSGPDARPAETDAGARLFSGSCIACHQQDARGIPGVYPSLVGSPVLLGDPRELALWVVKGRRPAAMPMKRYPTQMLQFGWMKAADAAALFSYLRSHFGNAASAIDAATVERALDE